MKNSINFLNILKSGGVLALVIALSTQDISAQTKTYLTGQKTGDRYNVALGGVLGLAGAGVTAPIQSHTSGTFSIFRFYYGDTGVLTGTTNDFTTLTSARGAGALNVDLAGADVYVQFRNTGNATIEAGKKTYFKLGSKPVTVGLRLNAGTLLGLQDLFNIKGSVYKSATNYSLSGSGSENPGIPITNDSQTTTKLVIDKDGLWYAAVTPPASEDYNSVRLSVAQPEGLNVVSLGSSITTTVHNAFTLSSGDACSSRPIFTSYGNTGISLTAQSLIGGLDLNSLVSNAQSAIDDDATTSSSFNTGIASVGVANKVAQEFFFDRTATSTDAVKINLELNESLISLNVLSGEVTFNAYNGLSNIPVATKTLQQTLDLLGLNIAGLLTLNAGFRNVNTSFTPGVPFDRVEVSLGGLASVGLLGDALRLYDVELVAPAPAISASVTLGANNSLTVYEDQALPTITASSTGNTVLWYEGNSANSLGSSSNSYNLPVSSIENAGNYIYYAAAQKPGCTNISAKIPVNIKVLQTPTFTSPAFVIEGTPYSGTTKSIAVTNGQTGSSYSFAGLSVAELTAAGLTLQSNGNITGTPSGTFAEGGTTLNFTVAISDVTLGNIPVVTSKSFSLVVYPKLKLTGGAFPQADIALEAYAKNISEVSNGTAVGGKGAGNYIYSLTAPSQRTMALTFSMDPDGTLRTNPSEGAVGENEFTVYVTDGLQVVSSTYSLKIVSGSLPVKLTSFTAKKEGHIAQLNWATTEEVNSESFDVERSNNSKQWVKIGNVKTNGESTSLNRYYFNDQNPVDGENLYRLKMIDKDGTFAYSGIQSVTFNKETISVYPNPVANAEKLSIQVKDWNNVKTVKVFNAVGKVVFESAEGTIPNIATNQLAAGLYVVQITRKDGQVVNSKFVKL